MGMVAVKINVPEAMAPYLDESEYDNSFERNAMLLYPLIQNLTISYGRAAEILGIHKFDLIDYYGSIGLPYFNQTIADLEEELADIHEFEGAVE